VFGSSGVAFFEGPKLTSPTIPHGGGPLNVFM